MAEWSNYASITRIYDFNLKDHLGSATCFVTCCGQVAVHSLRPNVEINSLPPQPTCICLSETPRCSDPKGLPTSSRDSFVFSTSILFHPTSRNFRHSPSKPSISIQSHWTSYPSSGEPVPYVHSVCTNGRLHGEIFEKDKGKLFCVYFCRNHMTG